MCPGLLTWQQMQRGCSIGLLFMEESYSGRSVWCLLLGCKIWDSYSAYPGFEGLSSSLQQRDHSGTFKRRLAWCSLFKLHHPILCIGQTALIGLLDKPPRLLHQAHGKYVLILKTTATIKIPLSSHHSP